MCLECKLHLSTHTYTAKYVSCNVSFFLQIFLVLDQKSCLAVQLRLRLLEPHFIHTHQQAHHSPPTCSKWAKSMVKWARARRTGNKHQLRRRHSTSQPVRIGTKGLKKEKKIITVQHHATQLGARFLSVAFRVGRCAGVDLHFKQIVTYKNNTLI